MAFIDTARDAPAEPQKKAVPEPVGWQPPNEMAALGDEGAPIEIADDEAFEKLKPGTKFVGPDKKVRTKPHTVASDEDFDALPEDAEFIGTDGELRRKPKTEDVGFTAQMLHDMARTPEGQKQALEILYPGKVKTDSLGGLYVEDDDGKMRRPKARGLVSGLGAQAAELAPGLGMVGGGVLGAGAGELAMPFGGGVPGGFGGAVLGAMAGRQVNNVVLGLAGIHEGLGPQITSLAQEGAGVALGEAGGRAIAKTYSAVRGSMHAGSEVGRKLGGNQSLGDMVGQKLPRVFEAFGQGPKEARGMLIGSNDETALATATQSADITNRGGRVPPSVSMPGAPYLKKLEEFDRVFAGLSRFDEANEALYNREVRELLQDKELGVELDELATRATKKVSSEQAGQQVLAAAQREMAMADAELVNATHDMKSAAARPIIEAGQSPFAHLSDREFESISNNKIETAINPENGSKRLLLWLDEVAALRKSGINVTDHGLVDAEGVMKLSAERTRRQDARHNPPSQQEQVRQGADKVSELRQVAIQRLEAAHKRAEQAAQDTIQAAMRGLRDDNAAAMKIAEANEDPSALVRKNVAEMEAYNRGARLAAKKLYDPIEAVTQGVHPDVTGLAEDAEAFLRQMPEQIRAKYPGDIAALRKLAPKAEAEGVAPIEGAAAVEPPEPITYPQLHHLRSWFRHGIDYQDLTPDMRTGALKHFEKKINAVLHDPDAPPQLREAAGLLDAADEFYRRTIPFLGDEMVTQTVNLMKSGAGADPVALAKIFFDPERTTAMRKVRGIVGENLWKAVQSAHLQQMLDNSKIIGTDRLDGARFAAQVEDLERNGLLATGYDPVTAKRITKVAADVRRLGGQLPILAEEGDTISSLMRRMAVATEQVQRMAELDPIKALMDETKRLDKELAGKLKTAKQQRQIDPLGFLYEDSMSALSVRAADRILASPDLLKAAATKFGPESGEFKALQQVYAMRFFQRSFEKTGAMRAELEKHMTEEVQALMFPGVTRKTMLALARDMEFLATAPADTGGSIAAASRVLHPEQNIPFVGKVFKLVQVPFVGAGARLAYGKYLATVMDAVSHPSFINWMAGKLEGDAVARAEARAAWQHRMNLAVAAGRVIGQQAMTDQPQQPEPPQ